MRFLSACAAICLSLPVALQAAAIGDYNRELMSQYDPQSVIGQLGRAVGRMDILTDSGVFPCTAFLVEGDRLVVARQCIPGILENTQVGATEIQSVQLVLGYLKNGSEEGTESFQVDPEPLEADETGHFTVLQALGNPTDKFGFLRLGDYRPAPNTPLWLIGHPMGEAQRISREDCRVIDGLPENGDLLHNCDTLPGDSSAPIIDPSTGLVVGMHYAGQRDGPNKAKPMTLILQQSSLLTAARVSSDSGSTDRLLNALLDSDPKVLIRALEAVSRDESDPALRAKAGKLLQKLKADMPILD